MPYNCNCIPQYRKGDVVVSLANHPPEVASGMSATIITPQVGALYAVKLPSGELHRWFTGSELQPVNAALNRSLRTGDYARIISTNGHPPTVTEGMLVKVVKVIPQTCFYDLRLENGAYHRWLAEDEITNQT